MKLIYAMAFVLCILVVAACSPAPAPAAPTPSPATPTLTPIPSPTQREQTATVPPLRTAESVSTELEVKSNSAAAVTVDVKPTSLVTGQPVSFDIAMNTHSVDLSDDLTKISVLRDDSGKEYKPSAWEGAEAGGHHRSGTLRFGALTGSPRYVELVIKGMAKVPERVFRWDLGGK